MKHPKLFVGILAVVSVILLLLSLPNGFLFQFNKPIVIPFTKNKISFIDPSNFAVNLGPVHFQKILKYRLGLDLQGGTRLIYTVDMKDVPKNDRDTAFESARNVIERRINFFGVTEPTIQSLKLPGEYRIVVELPGASDIGQAVELIGQTAQLTFWEGGEIKSGENVATPPAGLYPIGMAELFHNKPVKTQLTGKDLKKAQVVFGSQDGTPQVQIDFTPQGAKYFADITKRNVGKPVAIVLDQEPITWPNVQQPILNGSAVISGSFTQVAAKRLAIQLNAGALPAPLHIIGQTSIGPSLGIASLKNSLFGGALGFVSVMIFMIYLYKREGIVASIALIIYSIITLFLFKTIPITLTLAGVAGFVLSIGMAVDANILIFERMKEELRMGKPKDVAQRLGFKRAWTSIRDSNASSLITCFILFEFGSGPVRGFALTLAIGILVSMFSAIIVTRNLIAVFERIKK